MVPVPVGGVKSTLIVVELDTVAVPIVGELDTVVIAVVAPDDIEVPLELVAVTENVYIVFEINPDTVIGEVVPVPVKPPGLLDTVKMRLSVPPGDVKETLTDVALDMVATPIVGGFVNVVTDDDELDATDVPPELVAVTVNVYGVFCVNPDTLIGEVVPVPIKPPGLLVTV